MKRETAALGFYLANLLDTSARTSDPKCRFTLLTEAMKAMAELQAVVREEIRVLAIEPIDHSDRDEVV